MSFIRSIHAVYNHITAVMRAYAVGFVEGVLTTRYLALVTLRRSWKTKYNYYHICRNV